jgi:phage baseplate assembly protein W
MNSTLSDYNKSGYIASPVSGEVYRDVSFSFVHPATGDVLVSTDLDAIRNSIKNIILTPIGTRPFFPIFGTRVTSLLFELADPQTERILEDEIVNGITRWETRVTNVRAEVYDYNERNAYSVTVYFTATYGVNAELKFLLNRIR